MEITEYADQPQNDDLVAMYNLIDIIGAARVIAHVEHIHNGSGRFLGVRYTLTDEATEALAQERDAAADHENN